MKRWVCIHGHFFQPPRENPWLESVEQEDTARPYHDWNERVAAECYGPNAFSRILDEQGQIVDIVNNYARISFSFGPLLLAWLETKKPEVYRRILDADREGTERFGGHGGALAQPYAHVILPLAPLRDRVTLIRWGIADFKQRFGRSPEGFWLPETAVDYATLELLADEGIAFTLLAPQQCAQVRSGESGTWRDTPDGSVDPRRAYSVILPSGRRIAVFFCDRGVTEEVAFGGLLQDGGRFAGRIKGTLSNDEEQPQIASVFSNGEIYGHLQFRGDMALAYALHLLENDGSVHLGVYGEYLEHFPPTDEVRLHEMSSWSCAHGIERWRSDCGCKTGSHPRWHQRWRAPLRAAMDWLNDSLGALFETRAAELLQDPWKARDAYIAPLQERSRSGTKHFVAEHAKRALSTQEYTQALELLQMQRNMLMMYTSSGWFFDDISQTETQQNLLYASRAMQLAKKRFGIDFEPVFSRLLKSAESNLPKFSDGHGVYEQLIRHAAVDNARFAANAAVAQMYDEPQRKIAEYAYETTIREMHGGEMGRLRYVCGIMEICSVQTLEAGRFRFAAVDLGDQNIIAGLTPEASGGPPDASHEAFAECFASGDAVEITAAVNAFAQTYTLKELFRDIQRAVIGPVLRERMKAPEAIYRLIYETGYATFRQMHELRIPPPKILTQTLAYVLNRDLEELISLERIDAVRWESIIDELNSWGLEVERENLAFSAAQRIEKGLSSLRGDAQEWFMLQRLHADLVRFAEVPLAMNMYTIENLYFRLANDVYAQKKIQAEAEGRTDAWVQQFEKLQEYVGVRLP